MRDARQGLVPHARTAIRRDDVLESRLEPSGDSEAIGALLARNAARFADHAIVRYSRGAEFRSLTWEQFLVQVAALGEFLSEQGVGAGDRVVAIAPNRHELLVVEFATMCLGAMYVPIFAGYSRDQIQALVDEAEPRVIAVEAVAAAWLRVPGAARAVVTFDAVAGPAAGGAPFPVSFQRAIACYEADGAGSARVSAFLAAASAVDPSDPCLMMYTSGTTGGLKGVMLTHDNILSQRRAIAAIWRIDRSDRFLSYLPWHHSFGGIFEKYGALYNGATIAIDDSLGKDFDRLLHNWLTVRPTLYFSVPKVYQQLVAHAQAHPELEARIFHPDLRFVFTAAAPLPSNLSAYFAARRIPVVEGWGLTETSPCCTLTDPSEPRSVNGAVGYPIPGVSLRVGPDGEILVRGPNVMRGYYNDRKATRTALGDDGWFRTGDLGALEGTTLRLIARKDRLFKLLNAEKVVPTAIENALAGMNRYIRHVVVAGAGRSFLTALIFPDFFRIAEEFGDDRVRAERTVKRSLRETILQFNREHPIKYERIAAAAIVARELSIENDELTPSLKLRVRRVLSLAEPYLDAVYEPRADCDCGILRQILRMQPDDRPCFAGRDRTLDRCHECGSMLFGESTEYATGSET